MITIIAGSRSCIEYNDILHAVKQAPWTITRVISGGARGADKLGEKWAGRMNLPIDIVYANWEKYGKRAGYLRNEKMAEQAEALLALWDWQSRGTRNMIEIAKRKGLMVSIWNVSIQKSLKFYPKVVGL